MRDTRVFLASDRIPSFWEAFRRLAPDLARADSADSAPYDELLQRLQEIDRGLFIEMSVQPGACELIITADGNRALFPLVGDIVAAAPPVRDWTTRALKPKIGFPVTTRWERVTLRTAEIVFEPLQRPGSNDLGLRILIPGLDENDVDDAHNAVLRAMDHGLGEERLAEAVQHTEVRPLPADAAAGDYIPLRELETFLDWRARRRG